MSDFRTQESAGTNDRAFTVVARASGAPITAGTVNWYLKALSGANAGKWWRDSDQTWAVAETANAMTHHADGHWTRALAASPWTDGALFLEYAKESTDLHVPVSRTLKAEYTPSADSGRRVDVSKIEGADASDTLSALDDAVLAAIATAQTSLNTIAGYTDTLEAVAAVIQGYVDTLEARLPAALDGGRMPAVLAVTPPTASEINTALSTAHGAGSWLTGAGALGSGSETVRIRALSSGDPVDGCAVWITTDEAGSNVVAGTVFTDALGYTPTLLLDAGTYYVWKQAAGVTFDDVPEEITVVDA